MWCMQCQRDLSICICPDLEERLKRLERCPNIHGSIIAKAREDRAMIEGKPTRNQAN